MHIQRMATPVGEIIWTHFEDFDIDRDTVYMMADLLGPTEDFDGLVTSLEDFDY